MGTRTSDCLSCALAGTMSCFDLCQKHKGFCNIALLILIEPVADAVHFQDMDVMGKPVEQCTGEPLRTEHAGPFVERQVRGDDG